MLASEIFLMFCDRMLRSVQLRYPMPMVLVLRRPLQDLPNGLNLLMVERMVSFLACISYLRFWLTNLRKACTSYGYDEYDFGCYDSYDPNSKFYTDITIDNISNRQWMWLLCNEPLSFWQT